MRCYRRAQLIQNKLNAKLAKLQEEGKGGDEKARRIVQVEVPEEGIPLATRAGRHLSGILRLVESLGDELGPEGMITIEGVPTIDILQTNGIGAYLHGPNGEPPAKQAEPLL